MALIALEVGALVLAASDQVRDATVFESEQRLRFGIECCDVVGACFLYQYFDICSQNFVKIPNFQHELHSISSHVKIVGTIILGAAVGKVDGTLDVRW